MGKPAHNDQNTINFEPHEHSQENASIHMLKSLSEGTDVRDVTLNHLVGCFMSLNEHPLGGYMYRKQT